MKTIPSPNHKSRALTLFEVLVIIAIVVLLFTLLLRSLSAAMRKAGRIQCCNNLMQIGLAYRVWEGDHTNLYPSFVSVTNGGTMELSTSSQRGVLANFLVMSNELSTPKILVCPNDTNATMAGSFGMLTNSNISYFINLDASDTFPQMILSGDDNLLVNGSPIPSGNLMLPTNAIVTWSKYRHNGSGNIGLADGSTQQVAVTNCTSAFLFAGAFTNRIIIP